VLSFRWLPFFPVEFPNPPFLSAAFFPPPLIAENSRIFLGIRWTCLFSPRFSSHVQFLFPIIFFPVIALFLIRKRPPSVKVSSVCLIAPIVPFFSPFVRPLPQFEVVFRESRWIDLLTPDSFPPISFCLSCVCLPHSIDVIIDVKPSSFLFLPSDRTFFFLLVSPHSPLFFPFS